MAGKLSFAIAINLLTENFKRGANSVQSGLRSMQMHVLAFAAALGAGGLGLSNLVARMIDTARETNRVITALKNVSGSTSQFADNQKFLIGIAKKYGIEINGLTGSFAKFTASATQAGVSIENQKKIFESVSRSVTAFGLSSDEGKGVMLALSQMMGKGKISSEELRKQMGEKLPVAMQAMAKAAGVSMAGLEKLLKSGSLMAADILPKFADALNEMIPNVDTDNLETSINRLKNVFGDLVGSLNVESKYKKIIDYVTSQLEKLKTGISGIVTFIISMISGKLLIAIYGYYKKLDALRATLITKEQTANAQLLLAEKNKTDAQIAYNNTLLRHQLFSDGKRLASAEELSRAQRALTSAEVAHKKAAEAQKLAAEQASAVASTTRFGRFVSIVKLGAAQLKTVLASMWSALAPIAIMSAISYVISKMVSMYQEAKRIKNIFSEYRKEAEGAINTQEIEMLRTQLSIMNDKKGSQEEINGAQAALQKMLGVEKKTQKELNDLVNKRIGLLEAAAKADFYTRKKIEYEDKNKELARNLKLPVEAIEGLATLYKYKGTGKESNLNFEKALGEILEKHKPKEPGGAGDYRERRLGAINAAKEVSQNMLVIADASEEIKKSVVKTNKLDVKTGGLDEKEKKSPLQKAEEKYAESLKEYNNQLSAGAITQEEYNKSIEDLSRTTVKEIGGILGDAAKENKTFVKALAGVATPLSELEKVQKEYNAELAKLNEQKKNSVISDKEYKEEIDKLIDKTIKASGAIEGIGIEGQAYIAALMFTRKALAASAKTNISAATRDTTFDYKKTSLDIKGEELKIAEDYANELKKAIDDGAKYLEEEFNAAMGSVKDLKQALKIAEVQEDIKNLRKELNEGLYDGMKDIASSSDRVVNAFKTLRETLSDVDASGWERIMAIWNAMTNTIDAFLSIIKMIETLTEVTSKLQAAKETEAAMDTATTGIKATNAMTEATAEATASGIKIAASKAVTAAATTRMAAESTAAYAYIPFGGVALAGAQIAAMEAMILASSIPKFASGGIVPGGSATGDKVLARLNSGEMVLNQVQQSRLFRMLDSGSGLSQANSGSVEFKISGTNLVGVINNYNNRRNKIR